MPYVKTKKGYVQRTKKTYNRKRKYTKRRQVTVRNKNPGQLIAPRFITRLKYGERASTGSAAATISSAYVYNLNSIYDPNRTGQGHQPMFHDQLALLYSRYRVFAVSWRVEFFPTNYNLTTFYVLPRNDAQSTDLNDIGWVREQPYSQVKLGAVDKNTVFTGRMSLPKLNGQTSSQYKSGGKFEATFNSDPTELMTLHCGCVPLSGLNNSYEFEISLIYHVECFDPIALGQS